jgi:acylphosphatase
MIENPPKASVHVFVSGVVQGVLFRMFVLREAQGLGLCGTVRNLPDGRVEVCAEGDRQKLEQLLARLKVGPRGAVVQNVDANWTGYRHEYDEFSISYG